MILNGISSQKIKLIKTTIKSSEVSSYRPCKPLKLLFAGRQNKEKGLELLLDAIDNIAQNSIELHLCGPIETTTFSLIERKIRRLTKKGYIIVQHGLIHNDNVQDLLSKSHLLCYPSIDAEMCPLTILEAQAKNIPVIATIIIIVFIRMNTSFLITSKKN